MKFTISILVSILVLVSLTNGLPNHRIIGGDEVVRGEAQFQAHIVYLGEHLCGGVIVAREWVLTAAQCMQFGLRSYSIIGGQHSLDSIDGSEQEFGISNVIIHPNYNPNTNENDLALVKLDGRLVMNGEFVSPLGIPPEGTHVPPTGSEAQVYGWGAQQDGSEQMSDILRKVTVQIVSDDNCQAAYGSQFFGNSMICAGTSEGGKDSCVGDAGGPMVCNDLDKPYICGIVSWGVGCGQAQFPGVYTDVAAYTEWITETITALPQDCEDIQMQTLTPEGYKPEGEIIFIDGLENYETADGNSNDKMLILIQDRFDFYTSTNLRQLCDKLNEQGWKVAMPNLIYPNATSKGMNRQVHIMEAINNKPEIHQNPLPTWNGTIRTDMIKVLDHYKAQGYTKFGTFSFCWGGSQAVFASAELHQDILVTALIHPWLMVMGDVRVMGPNILLPASDDPPMDEYCEVIKTRLGLDVCYHQRFDDVIHGWAGATGDWTVELEKTRAEEVLHILSTEFCRYVR